MRYACALLLALFPACLTAQVLLSNPRLLDIENGAELLVDLSAPVDQSSYDAFVLREPDRLVVDLRGVRGFRILHDAGLHNRYVRSVRSGPHPDFTRIVFDLYAPATTFDVKPETADAGHGNRLRIRLTGVAGAAVSAAPDTPALPTVVTPRPSLPAEPQDAILPLSEHGVARGDIGARLAADPARCAADADSLQRALGPLLDDAVIAQLRAATDADGMIGFERLATLGITLAVDPATISVIATLDPAVRRRESLNFHTRQQRMPDTGKAARPAPLSAALDLYAGQTWIDGQRQPFGGELDGHLNLHGWVLQNRHGFQDGDGRRWQRRETQLIKDWPERLMRLSVGDLNYPVVGQMGSRPLSGVSLATWFNLQPYSATFPLSEHEFFLERDARVDIYVNGMLRETRDLAAGPHNVYDLPLVDGVNEVVLEITDRLGRRDTLRFFETQDQRLLKAGLAEFGVTAGVPRNTDVDGLDYDTALPSFSGFYRRGLSDALTLGAHLEGNEQVGAAGVAGVFAGRFGTIDVDLAASRDTDVTGGAPAFEANYYWRQRNWSLTAGYTWQDSDYANLSQRAAIDNNRHIARLGIALPRIAGWHATLSLNESRRWGGQRHSSQRLTLNRELSGDWRVGIDLLHRREDGDGDAGIAVQFYWSPPGGRLRGDFGYDTLERTANAQLYHPRYGELGLDARAGVRELANDGRSDRIDVGYTSTLADTRLTATRTELPGVQDTDSQTLTLGTALAYAGGAFALSRPLNGQPFAVIEAQRSLGDARVGVIRGYGREPYTYLNGAGDTAVLPNLGPYYVERVALDLEDLPLGVQIQQQRFEVLSGYRSGTLLSVGLEGEVYAMGTLHDTAGEAVAYAVGEAGPVSQPEAAGIQFFTDADGRFEIAGLRAGDYRIRLRDRAGDARLRIPSERFGRLELGVVTLE